MELFFKAFGEQLAAQGFPTLLLFGAVLWLNRSNREVINALNAERADRIQKLEEDVDECKKDREKLWERVVSLALDRGAGDREPIDTPRRS